MLFEVNNPIKNEIVLSSEVEKDEITEKISNAFDYKFDGKIETIIKIPKFPEEFNIGLIVGSSGSGKSTLLKLFGNTEIINWNNEKSIASHFENFEEASKRFGAVGLNSIPTWLKPYRVLSNGEKFRADVARKLHSGAVIDEFTSVVNRECAISCSVSISKYIKNNNLKNIVFASCHDDIINFLEPDWVYDTDKNELSVGRYLCKRPSVVLEVNQSTKQIWYLFEKYHYLSSELNGAADCYVFTWNKLLVAFGAIIPMPGKFGDDTRNCVSEHRIVVLPDYQGMGFGNKISEYLGELYLSQGYRYFGKTANPRMGEHRERSNKWRATSSNLKLIGIKDLDNIKTRPLGRNKTRESVINTLTRLCYSHEYIGDENTYIGENKLHKNNSKKLF